MHIASPFKTDALCFTISTSVNNRDNCPHISNDDQADSDDNGVGDACEGCKFDGATMRWD